MRTFSLAAAALRAVDTVAGPVLEVTPNSARAALALPGGLSD